MLVDIEGETRFDLHFRDVSRNEAFSLALVPASRGGAFFLRAGHINVCLSGKLDDQAEKLIRAIGRLIEKNTASLSEDELETLFRQPDTNPFVGVEVSKRVEILLGTECPSNCLFCTERPILCEQRFDTDLRATLERCRELGFEQVEFGGLEPTTREDLPQLIQYARELGFVSVHLISNAFRLGDERYMESLFKAGLSVLILSIHGMTEETETALTRTEGLFEKKQKALETARKLLGTREEQSKNQRYFRTNTVLTKLNLSEIPGLVRDLLARESSLVLLNYPWINGRAKENFLQVVPDYQETIEALMPIRSLFFDSETPVTAVNLPLCVGHFFSVPKMDAKQIVETAKVGQQNLPLVHAHLDPSFRYGALCNSCKRRQECPGVPDLVLHHYGEVGLKPFIS